MQNAFLTIRTVFLISMFLWSLLSLIFSSWNIAATRSSGMPVLGSAVFLIFNSCFTCFFVLIAFAGALCPKGRSALVKFECGWTLIMSALQLIASIDITINGPPIICRGIRATWGACASTSVLVPISWLAAFITITYFLTLFVASTLHACEFPAVWCHTVYTVPWFSRSEMFPQSDVKHHEVPSDMDITPTSSMMTTDEESCAVMRYIAERWGKVGDIEKQPPSHPILFSREDVSGISERPTWAQGTPTRRGVDQPFAVRPRTPMSSQLSAPPLPPKVRAREVVTPKDSHYVESDREAEAQGEYRLTLTPRTPTVFPPKIADPDLPIPLPRLSEWIRADHNVLPVST